MSEDSAARRTYNMWVGVEFLAIFIGMGALGGTGHTEFMPAWALLVVGLHFIPLAKVFRMRALTIVGLVAAVVAVLAVAVGLAGAFPAPTLAGGLGGLLLLGSGILFAAHALRLDRAHRAH